MGVLIEREVAEEYQNGGDGLPTLFSLLHPIEELAPVTFRRPTASEKFTKICLFANTIGHEFSSILAVMNFSVLATPSVSVLGFLADPLLRVISSCQYNGSSLLLLYHSLFGVHSIWQIKAAKDEVGIKENIHKCSCLLLIF